MYGIEERPIYASPRRRVQSNSSSLPPTSRTAHQQSAPPNRVTVIERSAMDESFHGEEIRDMSPTPLQMRPGLPRSYSTGDLKTHLRSGEQQTKVVNETIELVENHFPQFVQDVNLYTVRSAKLRDAGDSFAKSFQEYAQSEAPALKQGLTGFSECFAAVQDHRNVLVNRLEDKVVQGLSVYGTKCKQAREDVKQHNIKHMKELNEHKSYEKAKVKYNDKFELDKAETKLKKAAEESSRSAQILKDQVSGFERQKIIDLKDVLGEFIMSEMLFYSKALELYTHAYQELMTVDEEKGIDHLQSSMELETHDFLLNQDMYASAPSLLPTTGNSAQQNTSFQQQNPSTRFRQQRYDRTV